MKLAALESDEEETLAKTFMTQQSDINPSKIQIQFKIKKTQVSFPTHFNHIGNICDWETATKPTF